MKRVVFLLEEPSSKEFLKSLMPRISDNLITTFISFEGKSDLESNITRKLKAFNTPDTHFIVMRDQDNGDCIEIKRRIKQKCEQANKPETLIRIACRELESWYFGDLRSVETALEISGIAEKYTNKEQYRLPDSIVNPKKELKKITNNKYQQISSSREIGKFIDYENNKSNSFNVLINTIKSIAKI